MFQVIALLCSLNTPFDQCDQYYLQTYDDQLTCNIVATSYSKQPEFKNVVCLYEDYEKTEDNIYYQYNDKPVEVVPSFIISNLNHY